MSVHPEPSELAGRTVTVDLGANQVREYVVDDWWDRVHPSGSWMWAQGNPAAITYALRMATRSGPVIPVDDEVLYGHIGHQGHLVHVSEIVAGVAP